MVRNLLKKFIKKDEDSQKIKTKEEIIKEKIITFIELATTKKSFLSRELGRVSDSQKRLKTLKRQKPFNPTQIRAELKIIEQNIISSQGEDEAEIDEIDLKEQRLIREIERLL